MMSEMIWKERPAQSRRAASKVEKPMSLMMVPLKLVRLPLGTLEPNMAAREGRGGEGEAKREEGRRFEKVSARASFLRAAGVSLTLYALDACRER